MQAGVGGSWWLDERRRVAAHIARAEQSAAQRDVSSLPATTRLVRRLLLSALAAYRRGGVFPRNTARPTSTPVFVDELGTRCAMAHLLELGGEAPLVERIRRRRNLAFIEELADEPRLVAWLAAAGLTVEEAAAIQPSYRPRDCDELASCVCWDQPTEPGVGHVPATGVLEVEAVDPGSCTGAQGHTEFGQMRVAAIHGDGLGWRVGDTVDQCTRVGTTYLVPVAPGTHEPASDTGLFLDPSLYRVGDDAVTSCSGFHRFAVPMDTYVAALTSTDCWASLRDADDWASVCAAFDFDGDEGCQIADAEPTSLGILLAVLGALAARTVWPRRPTADTPPE